MEPEDHVNWLTQSMEWVASIFAAVFLMFVTWFARTGSTLHKRTEENRAILADHEARLQVSDTHREHVKESVDEIRESIKQIHQRVSDSNDNNERAHSKLNEKLDTIIRNGSGR